MGREKENDTIKKMIHEQSRYLERFNRLNSIPMNDRPFGLIGDLMLIEKLPRIETKTQSGIITVTTIKSETYKETSYDRVAEFGLVLMIGPGQTLENGDLLLPRCKPGDVVQFGARVTWYSQYGYLDDYIPETIGLVRDSEMVGLATDFRNFFEVLNAKQD